MIEHVSEFKYLVYLISYNRSDMDCR